MSTVSSLKLLIAKNEIEEVLSKMLSDYAQLQPSVRINELILLSMSYNQLKDLERNSLLTSEQYNVRCINLASKILVFIDEIESENLEFS